MRNKGGTLMLEHLLTANAAEFHPDVHDGAVEAFVRDDRLAPAAEVDAKFETAKFLEELGAAPDVEVEAAAGHGTAREAFLAMTASNDIDAQKLALASVDTPKAVRHLVGLLTAYDWNFVERASELRGYTVAGIMEETKHPDARIRLKALEMLGKVTEVALFTERIEVKRTGLSDEELEQELREKLTRFMGTVQPVADAQIVRIEAKEPKETI